jgi:hypothetical protein
MTITVICSVCGRHVKAYERVFGVGYNLAVRHNNPTTGKSCLGFHRSDHRKAST